MQIALATPVKHAAPVAAVKPGRKSTGREPSTIFIRYSSSDLSRRIPFLPGQTGFLNNNTAGLFLNEALYSIVLYSYNTVDGGVGGGGSKEDCIGYSLRPCSERSCTSSNRRFESAHRV